MTKSWRILLAAAVLTSASALSAVAQPLVNPLATLPGLGEYPPSLELTQGGCGAAAQRAARQYGGKVIGAPRSDGRGNCIVQLLVSRDAGSPPRRITVTVRE
jgi:hypothetical protein